MDTATAAPTETEPVDTGLGDPHEGDEPAGDPQDPRGSEETQGQDPEFDELTIDLDNSISAGVGGKSPTEASLRVTGGKFRVNGSFAKGEALTMRLTDADGHELVLAPVVVDRISFKDVYDGKTGQIVGCERAHQARVLNAA